MSVLLNLPDELVCDILQTWCESSRSLVRFDTAVCSTTQRQLLFLQYTQFKPLKCFCIPSNANAWPWLIIDTE